MVSRYGVVAFGSSLDQVGPFNERSVEDAAYAMQALVVGLRDPLDCTSQPYRCRFRGALFDAGRRRHACRRGTWIHERSRPDPRGEGKESQRGPPRSLKLRARRSSRSTSLTQMRPSAHTTCSVRARRFPTWLASTPFVTASCEPGLKHLGLSTRGGEKPRERLRHGGEASTSCWEAIFFPLACTRNTITPRSKVRRLITQDYERAYEQCDVIFCSHQPAYGRV